MVMGFSTSMLMNAEKDAMTIGSQVELIEKTTQKLFKNPSLIPSFTDLYHGSYKSVDVSEADGLPIVDTFLVERTIAYNSFGCHLSSREAHMASIASFSPESRQHFHSCGMWTLASYINHSCNSTARRSFIGDMMIVRATQDLPPDTEITFWYQSPFGGEVETEMDLPNWGFQCDCIICEDLQKTKKSVLAKRWTLIKEWAEAFQDPKVATIEAIIAKIEATYTIPASQIPRLSLWDPYLALSMQESVQNHPRKAIAAALKCLGSLGYVIEGGSLPYSGKSLLVKKWGLMTDDMVRCWMCLSRAYNGLSFEFANQAEEYAKLTYRICVGEDETFEETYGKILERPDGLLDTD